MMGRMVVVMVFGWRTPTVVVVHYLATGFEVARYVVLVIVHDGRSSGRVLFVLHHGSAGFLELLDELFHGHGGVILRWVLFFYLLVAVTGWLRLVLIAILVPSTVLISTTVLICSTVLVAATIRVPTTIRVPSTIRVPTTILVANTVLVPTAVLVPYAILVPSAVPIHTLLRISTPVVIPVPVASTLVPIAPGYVRLVRVRLIMVTMMMMIAVRRLAPTASAAVPVAHARVARVSVMMMLVVTVATAVARPVETTSTRFLDFRTTSSVQLAVRADSYLA